MVDSRELNEKHSAVLATLLMKLTIKQSLSYLKEHGIEISQSSYCRIKRKLEHEKLRRLYSIGKYFERSHIDRIEKLRLIESLMWKDVHECNDPFKKAKIKQMIASIQPYLSAYEEATKDIIEYKKIDELKKKKKPIRELESEEQ
jgi:hypothetical protein